MAAEKDPRLSGLEQSLINFLSQKKDIEEKVTGGMRRVRGLTMGLKIDARKVVFTVQIGMCEASFSTTTGLKERGSCFGLERYIRDWYERPTVNYEMRTIVKESFRDV